METQRLFVGLGLPEAVRHDIAPLMRKLDGARWTPAENLHLTMRFLGDVPAETRERMEHALTQVRVEPFVLPVEGVGVFPARGPAKVLWVGVGRAHTRLYQLRKQIDEALLSVDTTVDVHNFSPHITIGRLTEQHEPKHVMKFLETHERFEAPPFLVNEFQLFSSDGGRSGAPPKYEIVRVFPLEK